MKKLITLLLLSFFTAVCANSGADDFEKIFSPDNVIIDVRTPQEFNRGHLKNAKNIPHNNIKEGIARVVPDKDQTIVVYCRSGRRSGIAEKALKELGYKNVINAGKYDDLKVMEEKANPGK